MFEFQMEVKEAQSVDLEAFSECGMSEIQDRRLVNPKFRVEGYSPKTMDEALEFIFKAFYFAPLYVWINGEKLDPWKVKNKFCSSGKL